MSYVNNSYVIREESSSKRRIDKFKYEKEEEREKKKIEHSNVRNEEIRLVGTPRE